jgi:hypothetical protein
MNSFKSLICPIDLNVIYLCVKFYYVCSSMYKTKVFCALKTTSTKQLPGEPERTMWQCVNLS